MTEDKLLLFVCLYSVICYFIGIGVGYLLWHKDKAWTETTHRRKLL